MSFRSLSASSHPPGIRGSAALRVEALHLVDQLSFGHTFSMKSPDARQKLEQAAQAEKAASEVLERQYEALTAKLFAFQAGKDPAPTVEEFKLWRDAVELAVAKRKIDSGFASL